MILRVAALTTAAAALAVLFVVLGLGSREAAPVQPVDFNHKLHVGDYKINCLYCHINARRSVVAGVPSMQLCMGCHKNVGKDKLEVKKLERYWDEKRVIAWIKVNDLPDFVYFSHKRHVSANVNCQICHGPVESMERVKAGTALTMERCVACHRKRTVSVDCWTCHK